MSLSNRLRILGGLSVALSVTPACASSEDGTTGDDQNVTLGEPVPTPVLRGKRGTAGFQAEITPLNDATMTCVGGLDGPQKVCHAFSVSFSDLVKDEKRGKELRDGFVNGTVLAQGDLFVGPHGTNTLKVRAYWTAIEPSKDKFEPEGAPCPGCTRSKPSPLLSGKTDNARGFEGGAKVRTINAKDPAEAEDFIFSVDFRTLVNDEKAAQELEDEFRAGSVLARGDHFHGHVDALLVREAWLAGNQKP